MKPKPPKPAGRPWRANESANARPLSLVLGCFLLGIGVSALWFRHSAGRTGSQATAEASEYSLSGSTKSVLSRLSAPVDVRFYELLDPASTSDSLRAFAGRVERVLSAYQSESKGRLKLTRFSSLADDSQAAATDGITVFNSSKGEGCYLGIALVQNGHKETLSQLSPDWEPALEPDLSRALGRLADVSTPGATAVALKRPIDPAVIAEVRRAFPDLASISLEDGTRRLREAGLKESRTATVQIDAQIQQAQQAVLEAQKNGSDTDQHSAITHLRQLQDEQIKKLKEAASRVEAQVETLRKLKQEGQ